MRKDYYSIGVYLMALIILADQASKWWALELLKSHAFGVRVTPFFNLVLSWNRGITFGIFNQNNPWMPHVLVAIALIVVIFLLVWLARAASLFEALGLGFVMGGAIGNVIDRVRHGAVVDFLDFHVAGYHWYAFNLADSAIVAGVGLLLLDSLVAKRRKK